MAVGYYSSNVWERPEHYETEGNQDFLFKTGEIAQWVKHMSYKGEEESGVWYPTTHVNAGFVPWPAGNPGTHKEETKDPRSKLAT